MKKTYYAFLMFILAAVITGTSCSKSSPFSCTGSEMTKLITDVGNTASAYGSTQNATTCAAYKSALNAYIDKAKNCPIYATTVSSYKSIVSSLSC